MVDESRGDPHRDDHTTSDRTAVDRATDDDVAPSDVAGATPPSRARTVVRIGFRIGLILAVLAFSGWLLVAVFDDLDIGEVGSAIGRLSDAESLALFFGWLVWIVCQGALTASLVDDLPVRRGVLASVGPTAVSSVIPGPSDLPVRFSMFQSWGVSSSDAATAVGASGIFSLGQQLILPAIAGIVIVATDVPLVGFTTVIVVASLVLVVLVALGAFVLGSTRRTEWVGSRLDPLVRGVMRRIRRGVPEQPLGSVFVSKRSEVVGYLSDKWLAATAATIATTAAKCSLLVMALRFVGIPEASLSWFAIFAIYGLVAGLTAVPITPGNVGVTEVGFVGMLTAVAGAEWVNEIAAGLLVYRLLTWILIIPVGLGALGVWRHGLRSSD